MTLPTPTPLTDAAAIKILQDTITSLQSAIKEAEERATYYAANARGMDGPSDGSIYAAVSAMDAIKGERAATARAEAAESDLQRAREVLTLTQCRIEALRLQEDVYWCDIHRVIKGALTPPTGT
jgi:hypothetical protein